MKKILTLPLLLITCSLTLLAQEEYIFTTIKELPVTSIKNQNRTSTCWSFASVSFLESELIRMGKGSHNLSQMYIVWHAWQAKADKYIRTDGNINMAPGGGFGEFSYIIKNHGIVPQEVMQGLNYGEEMHVHNELDALLKAYADVLLKNPNGTLSTAWKQGFEGILDAYLGTRPQKFTYQGKEYTPQSFAASLNFNFDDYIPLTSFTHHPFYTKFALEISDNWMWSEFYNLPLEELIPIIDNSIHNGYTVLLAGDITEEYFTSTGIATVPDWIPAITQETRQIAFDNKQTTDDHAMHIYGIAKDQNGNKFYIVKDSWGDFAGGYKGIDYISEAYMAYKTIDIMVHKNAIPPAIKQKLNLK